MSDETIKHNEHEEVSESTFPFIEIPFEWYDTDEFYKGLKDYSYLAGVITALFNTGVSEDFIISYLINEQTSKHNEEVTKLSNKASLEIAKVQKVNQEKYEL